MKLRLATLQDEALFLAWRNDPQTRSNSSNQGEVTAGEHEAWFQMRVNDPYIHLYVATIGAIPVGQGRIERAWETGHTHETDSAVIGYSIDKAYRGKGYGKKLVKELIRLARSTHQYSRVACRIKRSNVHSICLAIECGVDVINFFD